MIPESLAAVVARTGIAPHVLLGLTENQWADTGLSSRFYGSLIEVLQEEDRQAHKASQGTAQDGSQPSRSTSVPAQMPTEERPAHRARWKEKFRTDD